MENLFDLDVQVEASVAPEKGLQKPYTMSCEAECIYTAMCV